jgi:prevent-host-death family protein
MSGAKQAKRSGSGGGAKRPADAGSWTGRAARDHLGELIRRAHAEGPQVVTLRGQAPVMVVPVHPLPNPPTAQEHRVPLGSFLRNLDSLSGIDLGRDHDPDREIAL